MDLTAAVGGDAQARTFEAAVYRPVIEDAILAGDDPIVLRAGAISANLPGVLGVQPILGRTFRAEDDAPGSAPVTLIGERLWSTRFGKDHSIVGRTISLGSTAYTVVGILPARFQFVLRDVDIWLPRDRVRTGWRLREHTAARVAAVEVRATDALTFVFVPAIFVVVALLANVMPAWRAVRINPVETLRI